MPFSNKSNETYRNAFKKALAERVKELRRDIAIEITREMSACGKTELDFAMYHNGIRSIGTIDGKLHLFESNVGSRKSSDGIPLGNVDAETLFLVYCEVASALYNDGLVENNDLFSLSEE